MSIEEGYGRFACDRSEKSHPDGSRPIEYLSQEDKRRNEWAYVSYVDANGVERTYVLCPFCKKKYDTLKASLDNQFSGFINDGFYS